MNRDVDHKRWNEKERVVGILYFSKKEERASSPLRGGPPLFFLSILQPVTPKVGRFWDALFLAHCRDVSKAYSFSLSEWCRETEQE